MISKAVSSKTLRSYAQDRLLTDMIVSSDKEASSKGMQPTGYILVLDDYTLHIVNSVVQMKDLIDQAQKRKAQLSEVTLLEPAKGSKRQKGASCRTEQETCDSGRSESRPQPSRRVGSEPEACVYGEQ